MIGTYRVLSALLSYPTEEICAAVPAMRRALTDEMLLGERALSRVIRILDEFATRDLYDLQERYVLLFDRTRSLSLHLFEHVHGESRDRGQAMVDLLRQYEEVGLLLDARELPDYLPVFLEFLATLPLERAQDQLAQPVHIFSALRKRLQKRKSAYAAVFLAIEALAARRAPAAEIEQLMAKPDEDPDDLEALDRNWADEPVTFGPGAASEGCSRVDGMLKRMGAGKPAPARGP
ncbi:MAG: nitrate reductase molybdenum cofactor assembly chaperone [Rhodospirillaceae bacterium]|nr:nitrate reductase molybdenum cofactor assembly chaperone [Rhodospirillaceae bacterium]